MSVCPKCNNEFVQTNPNYQRKFCSRSCANARTFTPEQESRRRAGIRAAANGRIFDYEKNKESIKLRAERYSASKTTELLERDFDTINNHATRRKRILIEQDHKCLDCGNFEWQGIKLSLEMDHIDGDTSNNKRENLRTLCPNCHSITPTWRGRNPKLRAD